MRIVYCLDSLGSGGIEQITIVKANALAEIEGNRVWLLYTDLPMSGGFHIPSEKVHLMDLGIRYKDNHLKFPWSLFRYKRDNRRHKEKVFVALKEINPDIVVSTGMREKYFLYTLKGNWAVLRELHVSKGVRFLTAKSLRDKLVVRFLEKKEFHGLLEKYDRIIVLSQYEKEASWHNDPRVVVIPNPATIRNGKISSLNPKRIVAAGRLESGKNYDSLIRMFGALPNRFNDWTLHIYGEGTQKRSLAALINKSGLKERVFLDGFVSDMEEVYFRSSLFVHTSLYETFGMVLLEAMCCGVPVVAYDCLYGPRSIISNGKEGFLVPLKDEKAFSKAMISLMDDENLRTRMGEAAYAKSKQYNIEQIVSMWMHLFSQVLDEKR